MVRHEKRTGERVTYDWLATKTGLSRATIEAIGSRVDYNPRLSTLDSICSALQCTPSDLLVHESPSRARRGRRN
jgi:DNA-binding Xre family transcriptional regulator